MTLKPIRTQLDKDITRLFRIIIVLLIVTCVIIVSICYKTIPKAFYSPINQEYVIELVDQKTVKIHSLSSDRVYVTTSDSIVYYLEYDNM